MNIRKQFLSGLRPPVWMWGRDEDDTTDRNSVADKVYRKVYALQVEMLYRQLPLGLLLTLVVALLVVTFVPDQQNRNAQYIWLLLMALTTCYRIFLVYHYTTSRGQAWFRLERAEKLFISGVIAAGLVIGSLGWWLYPLAQDSDTRMVYLIMLLGISGASLSTLSYRVLPAYLMICLSLLPMFVGLYRTHNEQNLFLSLALLAYIFFLMRNVHIFHKNNEKMLNLREHDLENALYLESILQSSTKTAIVATDKKFRCRYFNPEAERIFGMASK